MKYLPIIATLALLFLLPGCGGKKSADVDTLPDDGINPADIAEAEAETVPIILTPEGVGSITIGMSVDSIPPQIAGVYDSIRVTDWDETLEYTFDYENAHRFTAYQFGSGKIDVIVAESSVVEACVPGVKPGEGLRLGQPFSKVLSLPGVEVEYETADEGWGMWVAHAGGLWFFPDQSHTSDALWNKLFTPDHGAPTLADLSDDDDLIGYIGTGLLW